MEGVCGASVVTVVGRSAEMATVSSLSGWRFGQLLSAPHVPGLGQCKYAYVTVGYGTVGCASAWAKLFQNLW